MSEAQLEDTPREVSGIQCRKIAESGSGHRMELAPRRFLSVFGKDASSWKTPIALC